MPNEFKTENKGSEPERPGRIGSQRLELKKLEGKEVLLRNAMPEDHEGIARIIQDTWDYRTREWKSPKRDISQEPSRMDFLEKSILEPDGPTVFLVTVNGEAAGYIEFEKSDLKKYPDANPDAVHIDTLFVLEKYRGTGVGYSLLKYAEDTAQNVFNAKEIRLGTHSCNEDARKLYGRNGYEESGTEERKDAGFEVKGEQVYMIPLVKRLEPKK